MIWNKSKKQAIKSLMDDKRFDVLLEFYEDRMIKWREESGVGMNEFDTLKLTFMREGKLNGLKNFFDLLESQGYEGAEEQ